MLPNWITNPNPNIYLSDNYLVLDVENTIVNGDGSALNKSNSLVLSCWRKHGESKSLWGNEYQIGELIDEIASVDFIVAHNAKHELQWLARAGLKLESVLVFDTMIAEYVLAGNRSWTLGLGDVSTRYGFGGKEQYVDKCMKAGICPSILPASLLQERCTMDVWQTEQVFLKQRELLAASDRLKTAFTRCIVTPVLADIESVGMHLDGEKVNETYTENCRRHAELGRQLEEFAGGINLRSSTQRAALLYDTLGFSELTDRRGNPIRTAAGGRKSDSDTIVALTARNKRQREFVKLYTEYNQVGSYLSKNLEFFKGVVDEYGCIMQGVFNQTVTATHRLSSSGRRTEFDQFDKAKSVQFQNLPRAFKPLFCARQEGWHMGEIDGAQLEFRVAAQMGRDLVAKEAIETGFDVHKFTASILNNVAMEDVTSAQRQDAKADTFKPLYGGQSGTKAQQAYYTAFKERYTGIAQWQEANKFTVLSKKELQIPSGLIFYWPDTTVSKDGYISNSTQICNYPVQSFATADIIPIGLTKLWHDMKAHNMRSFIVNTVHDSAILEIHPDEVELFSNLSTKALTEYVYYYLDTVYNYKFFIPLAAGVKISTHWGKGEETVYNSTPPYTYEEAA